VNERLRQAIKDAGLTLEQFADTIGVDEKTVDRWLGGRKPYPRHRQAVATALGITPQDLWPDTPVKADPGRGRLELVSAFAHTDDLLAPDWHEMLDLATEQIDLLDYTLIDLLAKPGIPALLARKAEAGCAVRILISYATRARLATDTPIDEPYEDLEPPAAFEIARSRGYLEPLLAPDGIEVRKFVAMRFNSIIRADDRMLVSLHLWGATRGQAPLLHLRQDEHPGMFEQLEAHFHSIWDYASHPVEPEPELFPDPDRNRARYESFVFDDPPPPEHEH
jgi:transcriptional regulator with XRE-family HTH domain